MKKIFLACSLLAFACNNPEKSTTEAAQASTSKEANTNASTDVNNSTSNTQQANVKTYTGKMNDKIEVQIQVLRIDDRLIGELVYLNTKEKKPIKVAGYVYESYMRFVEFDNKGDVTGVFDVQDDGGKLVTEWFSPKNKSTYNFELKETQAPITIPTAETKPSNIAGTYVYNFGGGAKGEVRVKHIKGDEYQLYFFNITKTEGNIAELDNVKATITSNQFTYEIPDSEGCNFKVIFHDKFIVVDYLTEACSQGYFGHNASIANEYYKIK